LLPPALHGVAPVIAEPGPHFGHARAFSMSGPKPRSAPTRVVGLPLFRDSNPVLFRFGTRSDMRYEQGQFPTADKVWATTLNCRSGTVRKTCPSSTATSTDSEKSQPITTN
jgi:hypothetical protein